MNAEMTMRQTFRKNFFDPLFVDMYVCGQYNVLVTYKKFSIYSF